MVRKLVSLGEMNEPEWELKAPDGNNVKSNDAGKTAKHHWLRKHYGRPSYCMNSLCDSKSLWFDWAVKRGRGYSHDPHDYLWLCRRCHRKYDMTEKLRLAAIKNLVKFNKFQKQTSYAEYR